MLKRVVKSAQRYLDNHKQTREYSYFGGNAYTLVFKRLFCETNEEYFNLITGGLFPEMAVDTKKELEDYFGIEL